EPDATDRPGLVPAEAETDEVTGGQEVSGTDTEGGGPDHPGTAQAAEAARAPPRHERQGRPPVRATPGRARSTARGSRLAPGPRRKLRGAGAPRPTRGIQRPVARGEAGRQAGPHRPPVRRPAGRA